MHLRQITQDAKRQLLSTHRGAGTTTAAPRLSVRAMCALPHPSGSAGEDKDRGLPSFSHPELDPAEGEMWTLPEGWASRRRASGPIPPTASASTSSTSTRPGSSSKNNGTPLTDALADDSGWEFSAMFSPPPPPPPAGSGMELRDGMSLQGYLTGRSMWTLTDRPGIDLLAAGPAVWDGLKQTYVILFGVGEGDQEGIYSLRAFREDAAQETIIMFQDEEDAMRYASLLEATMERAPSVCGIPPREMLSFCQEHGYQCRLEPSGSLLIPPDYNVRDTDWERARRLRDGRWAVLENEPERRPSGSGGVSAPASPSQRKGQTIYSQLSLHTHQHPSGGPGVPDSSALARYTSFSDAELRLIRARLEGLLPPDEQQP